jgi:hypothetical protein
MRAHRGRVDIFFHQQVAVVTELADGLWEVKAVGVVLQMG